MGRSLIVGIALGVALLQIGCGGGTLSGGGGGSAGTSAGAGGSVILTGMGGSVAPTGAGGWGDPFTECSRPQPATAVPPNFLIALDTSLAMNAVACATGCGTTSKWATAVDAIGATTRVTQDIVNWGLQLFADSTNVCGTIDAIGVPCGPGTAAQITAALATRTASGDLTTPSNRPTRNAVANATGDLAQQTTASRSFVVLVTSGVPGCAAGASDPFADDSTATVQEIANASNAGFQTFVVGLGTLDEAAQASLLNMAAAGGATLGAAGHTGYFAATTSGDLQTLLRSLVSDKAGCVFAVPPLTNELARRDAISVSVSGVGVPRDSTHTHGWDYADSTLETIELYGSACAAAKADFNPPVIRFLCPLV